MTLNCSPCCLVSLSISYYLLWIIMLCVIALTLAFPHVAPSGPPYITSTVTIHTLCDCVYHSVSWHSVWRWRCKVCRDSLSSPSSHHSLLFESECVSEFTLLPSFSFAWWGIKKQKNRKCLDAAAVTKVNIPVMPLLCMDRLWCDITESGGVGLFIFLSAEKKKTKCQGQTSSAALSNNPLSTSWTIHKERERNVVFFLTQLFVRQRRWMEREGEEEDRQERQQKETAILSSLLSVTVHKRQKEEESKLMEMSVCVCVCSNDSDVLLV